MRNVKRAILNEFPMEKVRPRCSIGITLLWSKKSSGKVTDIRSMLSIITFSIIKEYQRINLTAVPEAGIKNNKYINK